MKKIIVITGASRGIGAATAYLAAERGYVVGVNYLRNREAARKVVDQIQKLGGKAIALSADVASETDVINLFNTVDKNLGTVTALVNNAGILELIPKGNLNKLGILTIIIFKTSIESNVLF
ncbi:MAG: SDR family NAD(P)-dependent oxidoreductase [Pleurocapsa sp. MO_226.B13]|nr:SDR family NAD(P)-dependent oxidoreductase [Pleurocapsa sp. MO_226.B13]